MSDTDTNIVVASGSLSIDGTDVGHISEPITVRLVREYYDVMGQHRVGVIKKSRTSERFFVSTALQEYTLSLLKKAWDQGTGAVGSSFKIGHGEDVHEHTLTVTGEAPDGTARVFTAYRAVSIDDGSLSINREGETVIPVEFECLKSTSYTNDDGDPIFAEVAD